MKYIPMNAITLAMISISGCAHTSTNQKLDQKLAEESAITTQIELREEAQELIDRTPGLNLDQRRQLISLRDNARAQMDNIQANSLKLRSVLVRDVLSSGSDYDQAEVDLVKNRIRALEDMRVTLVFDTVDKANKILGRQAEANHSLVNHLIPGEYRGGSRLD